MTGRRAVVYLGGASLLAAWLASAAGVARQPQRARVPSRPADSAVFQDIAADVQSQASRLRKRLATAPAPQGSVRNPFVFATRPPRAARPEGAAAEAAATAVQHEALVMEPSLVLLGIAEQQAPAGPVRTAMISDGGEDLIMATVGQTVLSRYLVVAIAADAVELKDVTSGAIRRLPLR